MGGQGCHWGRSSVSAGKVTHLPIMQTPPRLHLGSGGCTGGSRRHSLSPECRPQGSCDGHRHLPSSRPPPGPRCHSSCTPGGPGVTLWERQPSASTSTRPCNGALRVGRSRRTRGPGVPPGRSPGPSSLRTACRPGRSGWWCLQKSSDSAGYRPRSPRWAPSPPAGGRAGAVALQEGAR